MNQRKVVWKRALILGLVLFVFMLPRSCLADRVGSSGFSLSVVQQPILNTLYVPERSGVAVQLVAQSLGATVIGAHNALSGKYFEALNIGDSIFVHFILGKEVEYVVSDIYKYKAVIPDLAGTDLIDLNSQIVYHDYEVSARMFSGTRKLVLITCIAQDGIPTWGRIFIVAHRP